MISNLILRILEVKMGKFLDRIKRFKEEHKKRKILSTAERGFRQRKLLKLKQVRLEEEVERKVAKEQILSKLREAQAKRIGFERKIVGGRQERRQRAKKAIKGALRRPVTFRKIPVSQAPIVRGIKQPVTARPIGAALLDRPRKKGKGTPGLGTSFRVL